MPARRAYRLSGKSVLADITKWGLGSLFGALWGELQFTPKAPSLGVMVFKGMTSGPDPIGHMIRLGPAWLYYVVDDGLRVVYLLDLIPIL
jgi:hypothetical protein